MVNKIVPILEAIPHTKYVEAFGGGASILLSKSPVSIETYNDIDFALYDFFTVISDTALFEEFYRIVAVLPSSRQLHTEYKREYAQEIDLIKRVAKWFLFIRQSFGGSRDSWGFSAFQSRGGMSQTVSAWLGALEGLPEVHARLQRVMIENEDWRKCIPQHDSPDTLFYLDPPYLLSTRKDKRYDHEMSDQDHLDLLQIVTSGVKGKIVISGYDSPMYNTHLVGFEKRMWDTYAYSSAKTSLTGVKGEGAMDGQKRVECLWVSPNCFSTANQLALI